MHMCEGDKIIVEQIICGFELKLQIANLIHCEHFWVYGSWENLHCACCTNRQGHMSVYGRYILVLCENWGDMMSCVQLHHMLKLFVVPV